MDNNDLGKLYNMPVVEILNKIKDKILDPVLVTGETRLECVRFLVIEGHRHSAIATLFKVSDRTIRRDIAAIRKKNAVKASPEMTQSLLGELITNAESHYSSLKQIARSKDAYPDEKTRAEVMAWKVKKELIEKLYLVGFIATNDCKNPVIKIDTSGLDEISKKSPRHKELVTVLECMPPIEKIKLKELLDKRIAMADEELAKCGELDITLEGVKVKEPEAGPKEKKE